MINKNESYLFFIIFLFTLHTFSHFYPFERWFISQDDLALQFLLSNLSPLEIILKWPDRPLHYLWAYVVKNIIADNYTLGKYIIYIISFLPSLISYHIFKSLTKSKKISYLMSIIFLLVPNKLEIFHTTIYIHINIVMSLSLISILFFLYFLEDCKKNYLIFSAIFYFLSIFWYETAFFLPIFYLILIINKKRFNSMYKYLTPFLFIGSFYLLFRLTGVFGYGEISGRTPSTNYLNSFYEIFHSFFGRYMLRNIIYGFYIFFQIPLTHLIFLLFVNLILFYFFYKLIKNIKFENSDKNLIYYSLLIILISLLPNILAGSIGGRNLVLPAIGFSIIIFYFISFFKKFNIFLFSIFFIIGLIISQGINWTHVISTRINNSIYSQLLEDKVKIIDSDYVIVDIASIAAKIPYTLIERKFNTLNTYYGAQTIEEWGIRSMIRIVKENNEGIYIAYNTPKLLNNNYILKILKNDKYREVEFEEISIPNNNVYLLEYKNIKKIKKIFEKKFN